MAPRCLERWQNLHVPPFMGTLSAVTGPRLGEHDWWLRDYDCARQVTCRYMTFSELEISPCSGLVEVSFPDLSFLVCSLSLFDVRPVAFRFPFIVVSRLRVCRGSLSLTLLVCLTVESCSSPFLLLLKTRLPLDVRSVILSFRYFVFCACSFPAIHIGLWTAVLHEHNNAPILDYVSWKPKHVCLM